MGRHSSKNKATPKEVGFWYRFTQLTLCSFLAFPVTYVFNMAVTSVENHEFVTLFVAAGAIFTMGLVILFYRYVFADVMKKEHFHLYFYVFATFSFTSVVDIIIGLEHDGYISGFVTMYLTSGEAYLDSAYAAVSCYIDGVVFYIQHLYMASCIATGEDYRTVGLYWAGSFIGSLSVLVPSAIVKPGPAWATLLNVPYIVFPWMVAVRLWKKPLDNTDPQVGTLSVSGGQRIQDVCLKIMVLFIILFHFTRGLAALDSSSFIVNLYCAAEEPYIRYKEPSPFAKIQMLVNFFYLMPISIATLCGLFTNPNTRWMKDISLLHAGAAMHGQVTHIIGGAYSRVPKEYRHNFNSPIFWMVNLGVLIVPHFVADRCHREPEKIEENEGKVKAA